MLLRLPATSVRQEAREESPESERRRDGCDNELSISGTVALPSSKNRLFSVCRVVLVLSFLLGGEGRQGPGQSMGRSPLYMDAVGRGSEV